MSAPEPAAQDDDPVLDAARATVLDFGVSRTTVSEVARRAGLSRMTVYRRYPDGAALMRALMAREFGSLLERVAAERVGAAGSGREQLVAAAVRTVELLQRDRLLQRLLELEPEMLLPYIVEKVGRFQEMARSVLHEGVRRGQTDGSIRAGDPELIAATIETAARGFVLAAPTQSERERAALLSELARALDGYLRPV